MVLAMRTRGNAVPLYTIIECCRRRGINPFDYLRDVLTRLPSATLTASGKAQRWSIAQASVTDEQCRQRTKKQAMLIRSFVDGS